MGCKEENYCSSLLYIVVINIKTKHNLGSEGFNWLTCPDHSGLFGEVRIRTQIGQEPEGGN